MNEILLRSDQQGPRVLILAGVHGDEFEPILALASLQDVLVSKLKKGSVQLIPRVNEAACASGQRCGPDGLDLARTCPGDEHGSMTQKHAARVTQCIQACDYLIDLHTGGQLFDIYPLVGYMIHPNVAVLNAQRGMAKAFNLPLIWGTDPLPEGRTLSIARDANKPAIYAEFGGPGPVRKDIIAAYTNGCLGVLNALGMLQELPLPSLCPQRIVEDKRPQSGYLQGKMQSPMNGIFMSHVKLGDWVEQGQLWGEVCAHGDVVRHPVVAEESGMVLFVRSVPHVKFQDSLGGILPD